MSSSERYVRALSVRWLTPLYDPVVQWTTREADFKRRLVELIGSGSDQRMLDLGCGTGTLAVMLKRASPKTEVSAMDGDPDVLALARAKAGAQGLEIRFEVGMAGQTPYPDGQFDTAVSSLVFHHLSATTKIAALDDLYRVLRPGGRLFIADLGRVPAVVAASVLLPFRLFDGRSNTADNFYGRLPRLVSESGFEGVKVIDRFVTIVGPIEILRATKPEP